MKLRFILVIALLLIPILLLGGCTQTKCKVADWQDISWKLKSYGPSNALQTVVGNASITLQFNSNDNKIAGSGGCNHYFGSYTINNQNCELKITGVGATKMACADASIMQQEQKYFNLLQAASKIGVKDGELRITSGSEVLIYTRNQ